MKNMKKLLQKAMVFTLTAAMLVGTPMTASAAGLVDLYSISDGDKNISENENDSGTGTVTNTSTETGSGVLNDNNDAKIIGIVLDKDTVKAEAGEPEYLTATIVTDGDVTDEFLDKLKSKIHWELSNADDVKGEPSKRNPAAYVGISTPNGAGDRTLLKLNPKKGTKAGQEVVVTAKIDNTYYLDKDGNVKEYVTEREPYTASATVSVKEYSEDFEFFGLPDTAYVKHTINMNDHVRRIPETANDEITWISTNTKAATVTAAGVVTFKKVGEEGSIIAVGERGAQKEWNFGKVDPGTPATGIAIFVENKDEGGYDSLKSYTQDLSESRDNKSILITTYAKVDVAVNSKGEPLFGVDANLGSVDETKKLKKIELMAGEAYVTKVGDDYKLIEHLKVTDEVTLSSNKPAVATADLTWWNDWGSGDADISHNGVGTATITAKTTSGKKATVKVTVTATLTDLTITNSHDKLYSGQSLQMTFDRTPEENKDAVKWSIAKVEKKKADGSLDLDKNNNPKMIANPNATINAKGVLTIKPKLDLNYKNVEVVLESKTTKTVVENGKNVKKPLASDSWKVEIGQSSVEEITVKDDAGVSIAKVYINEKGKATQEKISKDINTSNISVPKNRTYTASVDAKAAAYADTLTWTTSNAKVASIEPNGRTAKIKAEASGTATITVSGVHAVEDNNGNVKSASVIKTTFKVSVKQPVKTITLNKPSVVLNEKRNKNGVQNQKVALKATLGPKGVGKKELVHWSVKQTKGADHSEELKDLVALGLQNKKTGAEITSASVSVNLPTPVIGDVFEITAKADSGASATSVVTIVEKTTSVAIWDLDTQAPFEKENPKAGKPAIQNTVAVKIGESITMDPQINISTVKNETDWHKAGTDNCESIVSYTVNKKGIVTINEKTGEVYAIKDGKVTITAKTALGKSAKLTVEVSR